ncbi:MAG: type II toxin-antitoxin system RelE/ParE family toxin, partial [Deltaproteobacteria bacterium]|nr:type II toxin-antitoxin system RelE/ParE family toxin [Deltaproteobacteria bacterium]
MPSKEAQLIGAALLDIAEHGLDGTVDRKPIQGKLWELRLAQNRIFYVLLTGPVMVLLHAYKKQSQ